MVILLDAMGGDNAPDANIKGAVNAINQVKADVVLIGKEEVIRQKIKEFYNKELEDISPRLKIHNATETIEMEDTPTVAIKHKKDSSMVVGFKMLKEGKGDVFISAGNSGALLTGATLLVGRIKGIDRPALAGILPAYKSRLVLIDAGANTNCKPINLLQFAQMSSIYIRNTFGVEHPRIGLLNIGTEETKGNDLMKESYKLLKEKSNNSKEQIRKVPDYLDKINELIDLKNPSRELMFALIDRIEINKDRNVQITYKFNLIDEKEYKLD